MALPLAPNVKKLRYGAISHPFIYGPSGKGQRSGLARWADEQITDRGLSHSWHP